MHGRADAAPEDRPLHKAHARAPRPNGTEATMIHHLSIPARNPRNVASVLTELMGGKLTGFGPLRKFLHRLDGRRVWNGDRDLSARDLTHTGPRKGPSQFPASERELASLRHPCRRVGQPKHARDHGACRSRGVEGARAVARLEQGHRILDRERGDARAHDGRDETRLHRRNQKYRS